MIIVKKTKLKLKKQVWIFIIIIIFLSIGIYAGLNIYQDLEYKKTSEYKLLSKGYTKEEINILNENFDTEMLTKLENSEKNEFLLSLINETYYIKTKLNDYLEYQSAHPELTAKDIITTVNTHNNYNKYDYNIETDLNKDYLLMVNKYYHLPENYEPEDLVTVSNKYYYGENHKLRKIAYDAFIDMWNAAQKENIYLIMNSSYRSYETQVKVYDNYKNTKGTSYADKIAARPGYSEHQTGLALDIFSKENTTTSNFKNSTAHVWLQNNAHYYGFIERYQEEWKDITGFAEEAWHWRYVGVDAATYIHDNNITFEEYYAYFLEAQ